MALRSVPIPVIFLLLPSPHRWGGLWLSIFASALPARVVYATFPFRFSPLERSGYSPIASLSRRSLHLLAAFRFLAVVGSLPCGPGPVCKPSAFHVFRRLSLHGLRFLPLCTFLPGRGDRDFSDLPLLASFCAHCAFPRHWTTCRYVSAHVDLFVCTGAPSLYQPSASSLLHWLLVFRHLSPPRYLLLPFYFFAPLIFSFSSLAMCSVPLATYSPFYVLRRFYLVRWSLHAIRSYSLLEVPFFLLCWGSSPHRCVCLLAFYPRFLRSVWR